MIQQFEAETLPVGGAALITPFFAPDERGFLVKDYSRELFSRHGLSFEPYETTYIHSRKNVLRGLHFQRTVPQPKLIRCLSGAVWGVIVDLRRDSPTLGESVGVELNEDNRKELLVPHGCAFGSYALEDSLMSCQFGGPFAAEYADGVRWDDPTLHVDWHLAGEEPVISAKDRQLQSYSAYLERMEK